MWRLHYLSALLALFCVAAVAEGQVYVEGVNDTLPVEPGWTATGGHEQAFRWTAQNTFDLTEIQWHCSPINLGTIRLREDTGGEPGVVLRETTFSSSTTGWSGAPFPTPFPITAGETYFATFKANHDYYDFLAQNGEHLTYYWSPNDGGLWNGPFTFAGHRMIKFFGFMATPCPEDLNGDGQVDVSDLLQLLAAWGCTGVCPADINQDGIVDVADLLLLLAAWGPCP